MDTVVLDIQTNWTRNRRTPTSKKGSYRLRDVRGRVRVRLPTGAQGLRVFVVFSHFLRTSFVLLRCTRRRERDRQRCRTGKT